MYRDEYSRRKNVFQMPPVFGARLLSVYGWIRIRALPLVFSFVGVSFLL